MKLTAVLLLLVAVGVALAGPQRPSRRFTPRRGQDAEPVAADEAAPEEDLAEGEEPAPARFRIASKPSGSSFAPKRSSSAAPVDSSDDVPAAAAVAEPASAQRTPVQASPSKPRTRGSRTFVESIKESNIPLEASQLEALDKSKQSLQRISSRPSSRPSSRVPVSQSETPALRTPSRPSSLRAPLEESSTPTNTAEASASKSSGGDQESRRQRLQALKKRPRAGAPSATPLDDESIPEEKPAEPSSAPVEATKVETMEKKADPMQDKTSVPKLDEEVTKTLDETIKAEAQKEDGALKKEIAVKETVAEKAEEKAIDNAEPSANAVTPAPEVSTTTTAAAPTARPRRINTLTKLRASRPVGGSSVTGARPRAAAAAAGRGESPTNEVQPRLSSRSGGRGNSRGGAALATSPRVSRPSSRVLPSRTAVTEGEGADAALLDAPSAGTTGSSGSFRRKLPLTSPRRNQVPLSIRHSAGDQTEDDESRVAGTVGRGPRTVRHSLPALEHSPIRPTRKNISTAPERKQGTAEKKTQRAGVRSLIERLRGRKTNRMMIDEEHEAKGEVANENVSHTGIDEEHEAKGEVANENASHTGIDEEHEAREEKAEENRMMKEQSKAINALAESQPKSELVDIDNTNFAVSTTTSKPTTVVVVTTQALTTMEKSTTIASTTERVTTTAAVLRPRNLSPRLVEQRQNSKRPDKRRPRGRVERRRRPINFSTVELVSSLPISSTSAEAATLPPQSTTVETTTFSPPSSTSSQTTILLTPSSTTAQTTTLQPPSSTTAETTILPPSSSSTTAETTASPPSSSTTAETTLLPPSSSSTTAETATSPPPSSTTAETTTLSSPLSTTAETTSLLPPSSTTAETTTLPEPPSSTTAETITLTSPSSTTAETTSLPPPPSSTTAQTTTLPVPSTTAQTTPRPRRLLPAIGKTTRQQQSTTKAPETTPVSTTKLPSPRTTTLSLAFTPEGARSSPAWKPRVAPEDPVDATFNRGGFRFQPHPSSESDITRRRGEVVLTQVGILEDTPPIQVAAILRGLGSRRRGLARPPSSTLTTSIQPSTKEEPDYFYEDY